MKKHYYNTPVRNKKVAQRKIRAQRKIPVVELNFTISKEKAVTFIATA